MQRKRKYDIITNSIITIDGFHLRTEFLEKIDSPSAFGNFSFVPVTFSHKERVNKKEKLLSVRLSAAEAH